jgi:hypothetical protein
MRRGSARNREIAGHLVIDRADLHDAGALEANLGISLAIEEILAAKVIVAERLTRPARRRVDGRFNGELTRLSGVELKPARDVLERPAHPRYHHVPGHKLRRTVPGLEDPLHRPFLRASTYTVGIDGDARRTR